MVIRYSTNLYTSSQSVLDPQTLLHDTYLHAFDSFSHFHNCLTPFYKRYKYFVLQYMYMCIYVCAFLVIILKYKK